MVKGDKVWLVREPRLFDAIQIDGRFVSLEVFDGWFSFNKQRKSAILRCDYDGGFEVLTEELFPTKKSATLAVAPKVLKAIAKRADSLEKELGKLDKKYEKWQELVINDKFSKEKATLIA